MISLLLVITSLAGGIVVRLARFNVEQRELPARAFALLRLAAQFRADCHAAVEMRPTPGRPEATSPATPADGPDRHDATPASEQRQNEIALVLADREIRYRASEMGIVREELAGQRLRSRDAFALGPGWQLELPASTAEAGIVEITLRSPSDGAGQAGLRVPSCTVAGELGRDGRRLAAWARTRNGP